MNCDGEPMADDDTEAPDSDEAESTFAAANYLVDTDSVPGRVVLAYGETWPTDTLSPRNPIEVEFVTGYGDTYASVPSAIQHAIKVLVNDLYENRSEKYIGPGNVSVEIDIVKALIQPYRVWRWAV